MNIEELIGKAIVRIQNDGDRMEFYTDSGERFAMYHSQDCCESVGIEDITGDLDDLLNSPITEASERTNSDDPMGKESYESFTWTFYHLATIKGWVTIRWLGQSNGYYSESVDFVKL